MIRLFVLYDYMTKGNLISCQPLWGRAVSKLFKAIRDDKGFVKEEDIGADVSFHILLYL
jgi:hypothetical protein